MDEYIERDALIKRLCERCNEEMSESPCEPSDCFVREVIKTIPAADVAPGRHGRWISYLDGDSIMPERRYQCSECCDRGLGRKWPYCPNCGAKMDGEPNE